MSSFQKTKLRILIIIWIIIEIRILNFMFLTRKLAASVNYIVFGALIYKGERNKINVPKGGTFCRIYEHKVVVHINPQFPHNYH